MENLSTGETILFAILGVIAVITVIAVMFRRLLDQRGTRGGKKIDASQDGNDSVYLS